MRTRRRRAALLIALLAALPVCASAASQQFRYNLPPGGSLNVVNEYGSVTLKASSGRQVVIIANAATGKAKVECAQNGNRIEVRTQVPPHIGQNDGRVDYDIQVPTDAAVSIRAASGPVRIEKLRGDLTVEGDGAPVDLRDLDSALVHARTVSGPITLTNVSNGHVELSSVSGNVTLNNVTGQKVTVNTTRSAIIYNGNFAGGGEYVLSNHSGNIDVTLPANASVDLAARSVSGKVQNEFPLQPKSRAAFTVDPGRSMAGTSNSGASIVRLRSFTGTITVKKQ